MKMLTLHQPWASLIALGAKTIETRSWSTSYRGPVAIHAGRTAPAVVNLGGEFGVDCLQHRRGAMPWGDVALQPGDWYGYQRPNPPGKVEQIWLVPLGAVVAVADLVDVVPIDDTRCGLPRSPVVCRHRDGRLIHWSDQPERDVSDQLPFGDFTPGRFAWLLDNVRPIEPVPAKGHQGLRDVPADLLAILLELANQPEANDARQ